MEYFSQYGQDKYIDRRIFGKKKNGFFIDVGANDGVSYSNTAFFEKFRSWSGICIEPLPDAFIKLTKNRSSTNINACLSNRSGRADFLSIKGYAEMLSGLRDAYHPEHEKRIQRELVEHGGDMEVISVRCITLEEVMKDIGGRHVDYLTIDVEGHELSILESIQFDRYSIQVVSVENNYQDQKIIKLMDLNGYYLHSTLGTDQIFIKRGSFRKFLRRFLFRYS